MNFISTFKEGQEGRNFGLPTGIPDLDKSLDGMQRKTTYTVASSPKVGKSTLVDFCFVLNPYLYSLENPDLDIDWNYYSFEIDRVQKEFKFAAFFMDYDYQIDSIEHNGQWFMMSPRYLLGRLKDEEGNIIPVSKEHAELLKEIYSNRIVPLFGRYSQNGSKLQDGKINFIEEKTNPTGVRNDLLAYADRNGEFFKEPYHTKNEKGEDVVKERIIGYKPKNPNKFTINILDHVRLLKRERNFTMKDNIDKMSQYEVELRNWCGHTFVNVIHLNRGLAAVDRLRFSGAHIYPTAEDIKDSGNLSEDSDVVMTLFNPSDDKYNLKEHFGNPITPEYRSIHIVESRATISPDHIFVNMYGNVNKFTPLVTNF